MNSKIYFIFLLFSLILVSTPINYIRAQKKPNSVSFTDNGKTTDSLKRIYKCGAIEYENSEDLKKIDSCLTVYLINSVFFSENTFTKNSDYLKSIARAVSRALAKPNGYKTINVFVVNKYSQNGKEKTFRTAGLEISTKGL